MLAKEMFCLFCFVFAFVLFFLFPSEQPCLYRTHFSSLLEIMDMYLVTNSFYLFVFPLIMVFFSLVPFGL